MLSASMLSRYALRSRITWRSTAPTTLAPYRRLVTTDAASSHTDPESVPQVSLISNICCYCLTKLARQEDDKPFDVRLSDESFETYELDPPPYTLSTTKKELKQMYYDMVAVRCVLANRS
jgi:pyruvate dehydrogenase E1 component alpha subunit